MSVVAVDFQNRVRRPIRMEPDDARVKREVQAECQLRKLNHAQTFDALHTALGTLVFGMGLDRAIAAGKNRAADHQNGRVTIFSGDDLPPAA